MSRRAARRGGCAAALALACPAFAASTLSFCADGAPQGFDIARYQTLVTLDATAPLYDQLLDFEPGTTRLRPGLAERWEISPDGLTYTLHLRRGVKFHTTPWFTPTRELNADDVLWSINRMNDAEHPAHGMAKGGYIYWSSMGMPTLVRAVTRVDDLTVRFVLSRPEAPFLADLAMPAIGTVFSAEYAAQLQKAGRLDALNTQPVGTGAFTLRSYQKDAVIRYAAHVAHWRGAPKIDNLLFAITVDPAVRVQRLKANECQVGQVLPQATAEIGRDPHLRIERVQPIVTAYLAPNAKHRFTSDPRFRQALWFAIDKRSYIEAVNAGQATPAATFLPPDVWSHDARLADRSDPERARELAKASGYDGTPLTLYATSNRSDIKRATELLQGDWARVGIDVRVTLMEVGELYKRAARGEHDLALLSWYGDNGDPDNFLTPNLSCAAVQGGGNKAQWCRPDFDELLNAARRETDVDRRTLLYTRAQRMLHDDAGIIPLTYPAEPHALRKTVRGVVLTPFGNTDFRGASIADR